KPSPQSLGPVAQVLLGVLAAPAGGEVVGGLVEGGGLDGVALGLALATLAVRRGALGGAHWSAPSSAASWSPNAASANVTSSRSGLPSTWMSSSPRAWARLPHSRTSASVVASLRAAATWAASSAGAGSA